jgi:RND family efflux transporter MFP subunit
MNYVAARVTAPVAGTIMVLPMAVGSTISQAAPLARLTSGGGLEIKLYVAERYISKMALGLPCEIELDAYPGEVFRGSVREMSPVVDPASRTLEIRVNVENPDSKLKAGMFAKVKVVTERKGDIVKIPANALIERFGEVYVFVVDTDRRDPAYQVARKQLITRGILIDGVLEIQSGLAAQDEVVVRGQTMLGDGDRVNVIDHVAPLE